MHRSGNDNGKRTAVNILHSERFNYRQAMPTPWGKADSKTRLYPGVYNVSTPTHGGIMVGLSAARALLSPSAQAIGFRSGSFLCFEEDCDWAAFVYEQPSIWFNGTGNEYIFPGHCNPTDTDGWKESARQCLARWHPEYFQGGAQ